MPDALLIELEAHIAHLRNIGDNDAADNLSHLANELGLGY
jgi:hypothetical protein